MGDERVDLLGWVRAEGVDAGFRCILYLQHMPRGVMVTFVRSWKVDDELTMGTIVPKSVEITPERLFFRVDGLCRTISSDGEKTRVRTGHHVCLSDRTLLERVRPFFENPLIRVALGLPDTSLAA
ncbi:hypothetical protein KBD34_00415 [Patescibacteria group bacterium]|nr:hypothetical protein [Patescibacteria group bacterium]